MTLLELTQNILSAMDAEQVTSIEDTVESMQVAEEIRNTYYEMLGNFETKSKLEFIALEDFTNQETDHQNALKIPDNVDKIEWIKYDISTTSSPIWKDITYLTPDDFFQHVFQNVPTENVEVVLTPAGTFRYSVPTNKDPEYWTTIDNEYVLFDSYNIDQNVSYPRIVKLYSLVYAEVIPAFTLADATIPDLEDKFFPMLLAESKSACFVNYKGVSNSKEEQRSRRQIVRHQNNRARYNEHKQSPFNYGR